MVGVRLLYDATIIASNTLEMIVMIGHILISESSTVLRTILADALADAAPAACACVRVA